jgi:hypothetical protein
VYLGGWGHVTEPGTWANQHASCLPHELQTETEMWSGMHRRFVQML